MAAVVHVITVIDVVHINVVGLVPPGRPVFRPRINQTEPEAAVLESGVSLYNNDGDAANAKPVAPAEMRTEAVFRNAIAPVASALAPTMMFALPIPGTVILPNVSLFEVLFVFVPVNRAHVLRPISLLVIGLVAFRPVVTFPLVLVGTLFVPLLVVTRSVFVGMLLVRRASVFLLIIVPVVLLGVTALSVVVAMLCGGRNRCYEEQAQNRCTD